MKSMIALALALCLLPFGEADAQEPPPDLVKAIAWQESGLNPLAVNIAGKPHYPATREDAERLIRQALAAGKSFDVGKMQINSWWMKRFSIDPFSLLDPDVNEAWGTRILTEEIARHGLNWRAVGKYHSPDQERGRQYAWLVYRHYGGQSASHKEAPYAQQKNSYSERTSLRRNLEKSGHQQAGQDYHFRASVSGFALASPYLGAVSK